MNINTKSGKIIVVTGRTGSGKDFLTEELLRLFPLKCNLNKIISHATRNPRHGEINHVHHHFCSHKEMLTMKTNGELVEEPVVTGNSYKATSKKELLEVLLGRNKIWRIDLSLAVKIAKRKYFHSQFDQQTAKLFERNTKIIYFNVDQKTLEERRRKRDGDLYRPEEYEKRDLQELQMLDFIYHESVVCIDNPTGQVEATTKKLYNIINEFLNND